MNGASQPAPAIGALELSNRIGMRISVRISSIDDAYAQMRTFGRRGWHSGEIPAGGIQLPLSMADKFDWSLIGARVITVKDDAGKDCEAVVYQGRTYRRRELDETQESRSMGAMARAVKYSRTAKPGDLPHVVEDAGKKGSFVTLAFFKGGGNPIAELCVPQRGEQQQRAPVSSTHSGAAPGGRTAAATVAMANVAQETEIRALVDARAVHDDQLREIVRHATNGARDGAGGLTFTEAARVISALRSLPTPEPAEQQRPTAVPPLTNGRGEPRQMPRAAPEARVTLPDVNDSMWGDTNVAQRREIIAMLKTGHVTLSDLYDVVLGLTEGNFGEIGDLIDVDDRAAAIVLFRELMAQRRQSAAVPA